MEVSESVARGERAHALDCATALYESVHATDSIEWKPFARSRLALTYNSVGRYDDVARLIPLRDAQRAPYDPHTVLPVCEMLIGRGDYETCLKFATGLAESLEGLFRAAALTHRAHALFEMKHSVQALADITEAVRMYDSLHGQSSYLVVSAYQTAYYITGNVRYRDMVRSLLRALDEEMPSTAVGPQRALTARQYQIASLAAQGATNREIANNLHLSVRTVGNALNAIYARLSIRARWQLAEALRRHGQ
jgi:DNA-binding CsgD family transcriptional regulator